MIPQNTCTSVKLWLDMTKENFTIIQWLSQLSPKGLDLMTLKCRGAYTSAGRYKETGISGTLLVKALETSAGSCVNTPLLRCIKAEQILLVEEERMHGHVSHHYICMLILDVTSSTN